MTEFEEDFAAMFEASLKAKRFEKGQTIEGVVVGLGPEVAFIDVGDAECAPALASFAGRVGRLRNPSPRSDLHASAGLQPAGAHR